MNRSETIVEKCRKRVRIVPSKNNKKCSPQNYPISIDTAIQVLSILIAKESRIADFTNITDEKKKSEEKIQLLQQEMDIVYGFKGDDDARKNIFDKIINTYSPIVKNDTARL
ncbi:MAG: hypothetical protein LBJ72_13515 [Dysgonamonadaceae bacterium]|jgi:hypothetical protein|nr:hypothetical protein [Dysgonamonadaceae bacterium]